MRVAVVAERDIERLQFPHGRCDTLRSGLSARPDHRPADLVLQPRESANQIGREIKPLRRCDACADVESTCESAVPVRGITQNFAIASAIILKCS